MATQYTKITPDEFNTARTAVVSILGTTTTGTPGAVQGYGRPVASSAVAQHEKVTETNLDNLRLDIVQVHTHQNGSAPTITNVTKDNTVAATVFNSYTSLATAVVSNRDNIAANQIETVTRIINTESYAAYEGVVGTGGGWKNYADHTVIVTFFTANDARYFFNSGSNFIFSASRSGGTVSPTIGLDQNTSWTNLLNSVTTEAPTFDKFDFYQLTDTYTTWYNKNASGTTYSANYYRISVKSNVANNQYGGATQLQFKIEFVDAYNDGNTTNYDGVDGTFISTMIEKSPKGTVNGGAITVPKPSSYVSSPVTGFNEQGTPIYITAAYTVTPSPTSVTENSATINFTFDATNYNTGNTVTFKIIASTSVGLSDFIQTGWTQGPDTVEGFKTLSRTATNTGSYTASSCSVSIVTNPDTTTEGDETFTIEATGTADGSGGGFPVTATFTVTDSSRTPTPGITIIQPTVIGGTAEISAVIGEGYTNAVSNTWTISSTPLTGTASLTLYGVYVDLINATGVTNYRITLPGGTVITPGNSYYTFPSPIILSPNQTYQLTIAIFSNSGPSGDYTPILRVRSNAGSADGSGPNVSGPSFTVTNKNISARVITPTINFSIAAERNYTITFAPGGTATGNMFLTLQNTGNARGTVSGYSVTSNSGNLAVGFNSGLNGTVIQSNDSRLDIVTLSSSVAGTYIVTASVTGTNTFTAPSTFTRSDLTVTVEQLFPEISVSVSSVSALEQATTSDITVTYTNTGGATLTISTVEVFLGVHIFGLTQTQARPSNTIAPGSSITNKFTVRRVRIGTSQVAVVVTSDARTDPTFTAYGNVTGTQRVPTVSITSSNGLVQGSTSFTTRGIIKKNSAIEIRFFNTQASGCHPIAPTWEDGRLHPGWSALNKPIDAMTNTNFQVCNTPFIGGTTFNAWFGGSATETYFWETGIGVIWVALKTGIFDNGVQSWHNVPGRMGDGVNQSTNQIRVELEIVPNVFLTVTPTEFVQGANWTYEVSGGVSSGTATLGGTFQDRPGLIQNISSSVALNTVGVYSAPVAASTDVPVGTYIRFAQVTYKGATYTSPSVTFRVISPAYALFSDASLDAAYPVLAGQWASNTSNPASAPVGTFSWFRRSAASNGTYTGTVYGFADDVIEVFLQGNRIGSANLGTLMAVVATISVTDGFVHWIIRVVNYGGPGYFAAAIYLGTPPAFYAGTATFPSTSYW